MDLYTKRVLLHDNVERLRECTLSDKMLIESIKMKSPNCFTYLLSNLSLDQNSLDYLPYIIVAFGTVEMLDVLLNMKGIREASMYIAYHKAYYNAYVYGKNNFLEWFREKNLCTPILIRNSIQGSTKVSTNVDSLREIWNIWMDHDHINKSYLEFLPSEMIEELEELLL